MAESADSVRVTLRIPGRWASPEELIDQLPDGYRFTEESLVLPDGTEVDFNPLQADEQFAQIFRKSCRQPAEADELAIVDAYTVNVCLSGPGGSLDAARKIMEAGAAIVRAGAAGVFIDNSALAHGGRNWIAMTENGGPDALSFAFAAIIRGKMESHTMGMHVLGLRDVVMKNADAANDEFGIIDVIRYLASSAKPIEDGHILIDLDGPRFQAFVQPGEKALKGTVMHNPFGRLKLVSMKDLAERN